VGAPGADDKDGRGQLVLSARGLHNALLEAVPAVRVLVIDADSKDREAARRLLRGELANWDVVICTPVTQSGVSWVGAFAETVFVAGGRTLPPSICDAKAGRRERRATTCVTLLPKTALDHSLPLRGRVAEAIREELGQAREQADDLAVAGRWEGCWRASTC